MHVYVLLNEKKRRAGFKIVPQSAKYLKQNYQT